MGPKSEAEVLDNKTVLEVLFRWTNYRWRDT